ncbi:hypothetical protein SAMN05444359_101293 [Neolewinella agarilytica]|uniref:Uncharacterized protein n=2 Tax=Neolewinella agarilytica TaxID=478744 RepID=A0A1H8ZEE5_9BACT|nr:hypothetical protein SAMN05444359_101293 [Neolewinella agarilytica]
MRYRENQITIMTKFFLASAILLLATTISYAQVNASVGEASDRPATTYQNAPALQNFVAGFPEINVGFLHVYANPSIDPEETYLMRGTEASSTLKALLPVDFQKMARNMDAKVYGAAAIRGINENMYIVRMDGAEQDRLELFAIRGNKVVHLKTLAYQFCESGKCEQLDSYITDVDGDTNLDLVQISRVMRNSGVTAETKKVFTLQERNREWKKTNQLEVPWESIKFYDSRTDDK